VQSTPTARCTKAIFVIFVAFVVKKTPCVSVTPWLRVNRFLGKRRCLTRSTSHDKS
jgi:hypothetical protein